MANELKHKDIGSELTKVEFEDVTLHQLDSQATGDLIKATSATQLARLPVGANDKVLTVVGGVPAWAAVPPATLVEDTTAKVESTVLANINGNYTTYNKVHAITVGNDTDLLTTTPTFAAGSMAYAAGFIHAYADAASAVKLRLYMGGVQAGESDFFNGDTTTITRIADGTRALSGSQIVKISAHGYNSNTNLRIVGHRLNKKVNGGLAVGSIKEA